MSMLTNIFEIMYAGSVLQGLESVAPRVMVITFVRDSFSAGKWPV